MSKASLLELFHGEKKYEPFSISENNESLLSDCRAEKKYKKILFPVPDEGNVCLQNSVSNPFLSHSCRSRSINLM